MIGMQTLSRNAVFQTQAGSDQIERIARLLLKRHQKILAQEHAELFANIRMRLIRNSKHDKQAIFIRVDLGSLVQVDDIFECQRMNLKDLGNTSYFVFAPEPDDVDPYNRPLANEPL